MKVLSGQEDFSEHPYDRQYKSLHCRMEPLDPDHAHFKVRRVHPMRQPGCSDPPPPRRWWRPTCSRRTDTRTASTPCLCLTCSQWTRREKRRDSRTLATGGPHMVCRHFPIMQGTAPPPPQDAVVAWLSSHQLCGHTQPRSPCGPSRGPRHWLHGP